MPLFDRFRNFSTVQQILLISVVVLLTGGLLGTSWYFLLRTTYSPLFSGLRPQDAATIVADLERKKIPYRLDDGGATVLVPDDVADATRLNVMTEDLPLKGTVGFELFNKSDMGLTDFAQKINYQRALQGELERTIMTLDGVESARVHLSLGEDRIFREDRVPPKASVTVRMKPGIALSESSAQGIARLIAAAVPNLEVGDVVILNEEGSVVGPTAHDEAIAAPPPALQEERAVEQYYEGRVRQALASGYSGVKIAVSSGPNPAAMTDADWAAWSPDGRQFPLLVTVSSARTLDASAQYEIRNRVAAAIGTTGSRADAIRFTMGEGATTTPVARGPVAAIPPSPNGGVPSDSAPAPGMLSVVGLTLLSVLCLAGVYFVVLLLRRPRRMSPKSRADFAARLRSALDEREGHAKRAA